LAALFVFAFVFWAAVGDGLWVVGGGLWMGSLCIRSPRDLPEGLDLGQGGCGGIVLPPPPLLSHCLAALCLREISFTKLASVSVSFAFALRGACAKKNEGK